MGGIDITKSIGSLRGDIAVGIGEAGGVRYSTS
jgi:hypothetical protein